MKLRISRTDLRHLPTDKTSGRILAVLVVLSVLLFGAFFLVGFDFPYDADARFNAPLLTDAVMWFSYVLLAMAVAATLVSVVHGIRMHAHADSLSHGIPSARIACGVGVLLVVSLLLTFVFGSSEPLAVNGRRFTSAFWLKLTDMFIYTSAVLGLVATAAVGYGMSGLNRRMSGRGKRGK